MFAHFITENHPLFWKDFQIHSCTHTRAQRKSAMALDGDLVLYLMTCVVVVATSLVCYLKYRYTFWQRQGCPVPLKPHIIFGHTREVIEMKTWVGQHYAKIYNDTDGYKFVGFYQLQKPKIIIRDLDIIRDVFTKEFATFPDRGIVFNDKLEPLTGNLLTLEGYKWKVLRNKLTPAFTIGKIKNMIDLIDGRAREMIRILEPSADSGEQVINIILSSKLPHTSRFWYIHNVNSPTAHIIVSPFFFFSFVPFLSLNCFWNRPFYYPISHLRHNPLCIILGHRADHLLSGFFFLFSFKLLLSHHISSRIIAESGRFVFLSFHSLL